MAVTQYNVETLAAPGVVTSGSESFLDFGLGFLREYGNRYLESKFTQQPGPQQNNVDTAVGEQIASTNTAVGQTNKLLGYALVGVLAVGVILLSR